MLSRWTHPGLFVTSAVRRAGKTKVAGAIAWAMNRQSLRVGALKPVDPKCVRRREGLVSEDAEILAHLGDVPFPLDIICPVRSREILPRALTGAPVAWETVQESLDLMRRDIDALVVEGTGGLMTPVDSRNTNLDIAKWLGLPTVIAVQPGEMALDQMLICVELLRLSGVPIGGIVMNGYDPEKASAADERTLSIIEKRTHSKLLAVLPDEPLSPDLGPGTAEAAGKVDWAAVAGMSVD